MIGPSVLVANVSPLIPGQFPKLYQDQQSLLVTFIQAYYEWMEQKGHPIYYTRNFLDLNDIDKTLNSFLVYFKEKYFVNVQLSTQADTRQLIKHAIDIYRSKGTERQIKLLFQLIFGEQVEFYYPKTDIFRLSDGKWRVPVYLELSILDTNILLSQKEIKGINSGATAFVDSIIRKQDVGAALVDVAYISSVVGNFQTGEKIVPVDGSLNATLCPIISGSLTNIVVTSSGNSSAYSVGDLVTVTSNTGEAAIGRVAQTSVTTGVLNFSLNDGGYGYTANAVCSVSNTILVTNNISFTNSYAQRTFNLFETISQPMATINYINLTGSFNPGDILTAYSNTSVTSGNGTILSVTPANSTTGSLLVATNPIRNFVFDANKFNTSNWATANCTVTANSMISPDGTNDGWLWQRTQNTAFIGENALVGNTAGIWTYSLYAKAGTGNYLAMYLSTGIGDPNAFRITFNLANVVVSALSVDSSISNFSSSITPVANGWFLCSATATFPADASAGGIMRPNFSASQNNANVDSPDSANNTTIYVYGAQLLLKGDTSGSLNANLLFNQGNVVSANLAASNGYTNSTATGMYIGHRTHTLNFPTANGLFISGESIVQYIDNGPQYTGIGTIVTISSSNVMISNVQGIFQSGFQIKGLQSGATANLTNIQATLGLINVSGTFNGIPGNYIVSQSTNAQVTVATSGTGGSFGIANNLAYSETVPLNTDNVSTYATVNLNAASFGFPANASINATSGNVAGALTMANTLIGQVQTVLSFNQGTGYLLDSFNLIYEPKVYPNEVFDNTLYFTGATKSFVGGEIITQAATNARAIIRSTNSSVILTENLRYLSNNQFVVTVNTATQIVGNTSGAVANVIDTEMNGWLRPEGVNANVAGQVSSALGSITQVQVIQSGFDFIDSRPVFIGPALSGVGQGIATGLGFLGKQGFGQGFYEQKGGFLSNVKKLFDGNFYQEFSYEVLSSQTIDKYEQMLRQLAHVAGIALFGRVIFKSGSNLKVVSQPSQTAVSIVNWTPSLDFTDITGENLLQGIVLDVV